MKKTRNICARLSLLLLACLPAQASIFIVAICKDGVVAVADSRFTFSDADSGRALAYADGIEKIVRFDSAMLAETGQGFLSEERFDQFVARFAEASGSLPVELVLPSLLDYGHRRLPAQDIPALEQQHMAVAKYRRGQAVICGYDGQLRPCVSRGYIQSSPTDFEKLVDKLPSMAAQQTASAARASIERYIAAKGKSATMGGEFSAVVLTPGGAHTLWTLKNPIPARTIDELIQMVESHRLAVTLIPPATRAELDELLH
ncbi:MAG TPA: hypothetical protein VKV17_00835 [Bryobacteraceae bacterium]|nr:hypothetical protein [Bryobacteraceae bacterium]